MSIPEGYTVIYKVRLKTIRTALNVSQNKLSLKSGIPAVRIRHYETQSAKSIPHLDLLSICAALDIPSAYLTKETVAIKFRGNKVDLKGV